ncbi:MAG: Na/Pi symporter [Deltaproteobacteria bacterium]|nr:Na/Pi symporter [Deltaproteobacteria bacterium]
MASERLRTALRWLLTLAVLALVVSDWGDEREPDRSQPSDEPGAIAAFHITSIGEADVSPGDALVVEYVGAAATPPVEATIAHRPAEILVRNPSSVVVRIASDTPTGKAGLRLTQGASRTKSWDLQIRASNQKKLLTRLFGGLALFIYGLGLLARGLRGLAGNRVRTLLGRWTRSSPQAVGVGILVGGLTQLTTSAAAFAIGLVDARLLAIGATVAIFVGAQLGAALTGAMLPAALASEGLLVIALGVIWTRLATGRRGAAIAKLMLGAGLMLYGLHLLQTSVEPLVSDPKLLPYVAHLRGEGLAAIVICALTGAALALVLQGPGPVYILVLGLTQTSGVMPRANALAILAGTNLGAALGMALIAWQAGRAARPLVATHLAFGAFATLFALATLPLWDAILPATDVVDYGQRIVRPLVSRDLALAFAVTELAAVALWLIALPALARRATQRRVEPAPSIVPHTLASDVERAVAAVLASHRAALDGALEMSCTSDRGHAHETEVALAEARRQLEQQYRIVSAAPTSPALERATQTVVATLQLQRQVEQLVNVAELGIERGLRLAPEEQARLRDMHALASESCAAAIATLERGVAVDLEAAGGREIQLNLLEAEARRARAILKRSESASFGLGLADLIDTYEHVGNHLYRVCKTMSADAEELS